MSNGRIFVKPKTQPEGQPAMKVRKPVNGHLKAEGEWVNPESYWLRRINDGDVIHDADAVQPVEPAPAPAPAAAAADSVDAAATKPRK